MVWTNNPIADAERYTAKQEEALERLPKCGWCDKPIQDEECYLIEYEAVCQDCLDTFFKVRTEDL